MNQTTVWKSSSFWYNKNDQKKS